MTAWQLQLQVQTGTTRANERRAHVKIHKRTCGVVFAVSWAYALPQPLLPTRCRVSPRHSLLMSSPSYVSEVAPASPVRTWLPLIAKACTAHSRNCSGVRFRHIIMATDTRNARWMYTCHTWVNDTRRTLFCRIIKSVQTELISSLCFWSLLFVNSFQF